MRPYSWVLCGFFVALLSLGMEPRTAWAQRDCSEAVDILIDGFDGYQNWNEQLSNGERQLGAWTRLRERLLQEQRRNVALYGKRSETIQTEIGSAENEITRLRPEVDFARKQLAFWSETIKYRYGRMTDLGCADVSRLRAAIAEDSGLRAAIAKDPALRQFVKLLPPKASSTQPPKVAATRAPRVATTRAPETHWAGTWVKDWTRNGAVIGTSTLVISEDQAGHPPTLYVEFTDQYTSGARTHQVYTCQLSANERDAICRGVPPVRLTLSSDGSITEGGDPTPYRRTK